MAEFKKNLKAAVGKYTGLAAIVALETPIHESLHCVAAEVTAGDCQGIAFSEHHWYLKPLEYLTLGFVKVTQLPPGTEGMTQQAHQDSFFGKIGSIATSALPEFVYTTIGMALVRRGVEKWREKPIEGLVQTVVGATCMSSTLEYMRISFFGAQPGHDYYNVTARMLQIAHLPEGLASVLTPFVGIPLLLGAAYLTAGYMTDNIKKRI